MLRQFLISNVLITYEKSFTRKYPDIQTRCLSEDELPDKYNRLTFGSPSLDKKIVSMFINFDISLEELMQKQIITNHTS